MYTVGLKRLPALLSQGETLNSLSLHWYEIIMTEPLHDLKNLICNILDELPKQLPNRQLCKDMEAYITTLKGKCETVIKLEKI